MLVGINVRRNRLFRLSRSGLLGSARSGLLCGSRFLCRGFLCRGRSGLLCCSRFLCGRCRFACGGSLCSRSIRGSVSRLLFFETTNEVFELRNLLVANHQLVTLILDGGQERIEFIVFDVLWIEIVDTRDEVAQNVHIIGESIVGGSVDAAITAITAGFGGDEAEVVGSLEIVPVLEQTLVASDAHAIGHRVEFFESFLLHHVAQPRREVALFVYPSGGDIPPSKDQRS